MTKLLFIFFASLSFSVKAQVAGELVGKWNVVAMYDEDVYLHIVKDSVSVANSPRHAGLSSASLDSVKNLLRPMFEAFKNAYFIFNKDHSYETFIEAVGSEKGTYIVIAAPGIVELTAKGIKEMYNYKIENNILELIPVQPGERVVLIMEKEIK